MFGVQLEIVGPPCGRQEAAVADLLFRQLMGDKAELGLPRVVRDCLVVLQAQGLL